MSTIHSVKSSVAKTPASSAWTRVRSEIVALAQALAAPGRLVSQVERLRELQEQAQRIEASDPARAAALNRAAARCLQH